MKRYTVILSDPPWWYADRQRHRPSNYKRMKERELRALNVHMLGADDSALLMWCTGPTIADGQAHRVMWSWGYEPRTVAFVWGKVTQDGTRPKNTAGHYTLPSYEYVLLGVRGSVPVIGNPYQELRSNPGEHSEKPKEIHERVVQLFGDVPRLEMFARGHVPEGWDGHGDQCDSAVVIL
jgi:N6-adenosine-specific RNA methylase IME4